VRRSAHFSVCVILLRLGERKRHSVDYIELLLGAEQGNYRPIYARPYIKYAAIANLTTLAASGRLVVRSLAWNNALQILPVSDSLGSKLVAR
jgi:hypothetical protein